MTRYFKLEKHGAVAVLTFDRPEKRNPVNDESMFELERNLVEIRDDDQARVLLFTGSGNAFCAGADISRLKGVSDPAERRRIFSTIAPSRGTVLPRTINLLRNLPMPTIAAVNGYAVGAGFFLVLCCDLRIAIAEAEFWAPEIDLGSPGSRATERFIAEHVGPARAKEIMFTCRRFKAEEFYRWGLLNQVVSREELMPKAMEMAQSLAAKDMTALRQAKENINGSTLDW